MCFFRFATVRSQEGKRCLIRSDIHTHHARTRQNRARYIAIFRRTPNRSAAAVAWLRELLVDDSILALMRIHMVVAMKNSTDLVFDEQLVNRHRPARTLLRKNVFAIRILAAPLIAIRTFDSAAAVFSKTANEVVDEDKFIRCLTFAERFFKPFVLLGAEGMSPVILIRPARRVPKWVQRDK